MTSDNVTNIDTVKLACGMKVANISEQQCLDLVAQFLDAKKGGWLLTANLDFVRRYTQDVAMRALYDAADVTVADGMPLVWASKLQGNALPERIAGSSLAVLLAERAAACGHSIYLLGGNEGTAEQAAGELRRRWPTLKISGWSSPWIASPPSEQEVSAIVAELKQHPADIIYVALGSPKQEQLIDSLRDAFPHTWMIGIGISLSFITGEVDRAPDWMQRSGLEWLHRLIQEPTRLTRRYLIKNLPFSLQFMFHSIAMRFR